MQLEGVSPNAVTLVCSLKVCGSIGAIDKGREIHAETARKGLEQDLFVGNTLVDMYCKCGSLAKAREVFDKLLVRDIVSWNILISGFAKHSLSGEVLNCYKQMQLEGVTLNAVAFVCSLKACANTGAIGKGRDIHVAIARRGLERDPFVGSTLVDMYAKCGVLAKAQEVFDKLPDRVVVSWTALIAGYAEHGLGEEALDCFEQMRLEGVSPNAVTFVCSLKACGRIGAIEKGQEIHTEIARKGLERDPSVGNTLVDMYAKCGLLTKAQEVSDKLPLRDVVSWNILIAGYSEGGFGEEALKCFEQMQLEGVSPDAVTFGCSLKACHSIGALDRGWEVHTEIVRKGLERDPFVGKALVDMYVKCGSFAKARDLLDKIPVRDVVLWNALMAGYAEHELGEQVLNCFKQMLQENVFPDAVTYVFVFKACGNTRTIEKGLEVHAEIVRRGLEGDHFVGSTLVDMYAKFGSLVKAQEVFDKLQDRDVVTWTALIAGYTEHGLDEQVLDCLEQMQQEGVSPNVVTYVCGLKACGSTGAIYRGQDLHTEIARKELERDPFLGNTLVDMYAKCGSLANACRVFEKLPTRDIVSWTALITGFVQLGENDFVFFMLERMIGAGIKPNGITFLSVLTVCSHVGLVNKAQEYFESMSKDFGITPAIEHHACLVDLLGRAGQLHEAITMVEKMPLQPNLVLWLTLLGACQKWGNVELGRQAFEHAVELDGKDATAYVLMSNIYADAHMQEDEEKVEAMRGMKEERT